MNWGLSGQIVVMNVSNLLPFYETKHRRVLVTTCFGVCPFLAPPNHWLTVASIGPFIRLLQRTEMPVSRFVLLLLAAKAEAQRPSLRQPQALTTDDKIAASRARTSADPAGETRGGTRIRHCGLRSVWSHCNRPLDNLMAVAGNVR